MRCKPSKARLNPPGRHSCGVDTEWGLLGLRATCSWDEKDIRAHTPMENTELSEMILSLKITTDQLVYKWEDSNLILFIYPVSFLSNISFQKNKNTADTVGTVEFQHRISSTFYQRKTEANAFWVSKTTGTVLCSSCILNAAKMWKEVKEIDTLKLIWMNPELKLVTFFLLLLHFQH